MSNDTTPYPEFPATITSFLLGLSIALVSLPGWLANLLLLVVLLYGGLVKTGRTIYTLMASLALGDFVVLSVMLFYLAPSSMLQDWLLPMGWINIPADTFLICWYHGWFMMSAISMNRYVAVCHGDKYQSIFTHRFTNGLVALSWLAAGLIATNVLWMPCCRILMSFITYSFMLEAKSATEANVADAFVEMPGNLGTSLIMAFCYANVMHEIYKNSNMAGENRNATSSMSQEMRLALQFLCISSVFTGAWIMYRVCPIFLGTNTRELYVSVTYLTIFNSSINPFLYFKYTTEIREKLAELRGVQSQVRVIQVAPSKTAETNRNQEMELKDIE